MRNVIQYVEASEEPNRKTIWIKKEDDTVNISLDGEFADFTIEEVKKIIKILKSCIDE